MALLKKRSIAMRQINELKKVLKNHFNWNGARLFFIATFLSALYLVRTVNFAKISNVMYGQALNSSKYKRIQRFFKDFDIDYILIALFVGSLVPNKDEKWMLTFDRTNWKFGKQNINILTLAIVYDGIAFPLLWIMLDKNGNSSTKERIDLLNKFIDIFGTDKIECLLADREFIGTEWFKYLIYQNKIRIRIRVKDCEYINKKNGDSAPIKNFFRNIKIGQQKIIHQKRCLWGLWLYITGTKSAKGELVIVVTQERPETAIKDYEKRWEIETLFKCLKSSGFNFEDTHLNDIDRISKLMAILTIAFCWAYITGEWMNNKRPIKLKSHGRKEKSVFRYGLDCLGEIFAHLSAKTDEFKIVIRFLSCT